MIKKDDKNTQLNYVVKEHNNSYDNYDYDDDNDKHNNDNNYM